MNISGIVFDNHGSVRAGWRASCYLLLSALGGAGFITAYRATAPRIFPAVVAYPRLNQITAYALICSAAILAAFTMLRFFDRRPLRTLGYSMHNRMGIEVAQGIFLGFFMISLLSGIEWASGYVSFSWTGSGAGQFLLLLIYSTAILAVSSAVEELLARGYAFQALVQGIGGTGAVCISSIAFSLAHFSNPHFNWIALFNTGLAGVWLSVAYLKTRSLWLPTSLHMTWNLSLGFVFGYPVSGSVAPYAVTSISQRGPDWITGGAYGPEGGVLCTGILLAAAAFMLRSKRIKPAAKACSLWYSA
jgi:uncharacterized protein